MDRQDKSGIWFCTRNFEQMQKVRCSMQAYTSFAAVYDKFMNNVPYMEWADYLTSLLSEFGVTEGLVCELGCGTGQMTRRLAARGYDMIGIDSSFEMLNLAREQEDLEKGSEPVSSGILYLQQDMCEIELYGTVAAFVSICDSMNYLTTEEELRQVFLRVNNYLDSRGIFIFDLKTEYYFEHILGNTTFAENQEDCSLIWENSFDKKTGLNEYALTIYCRRNEQKELYERTEEQHLQRAYPLQVIKEQLLAAGMEFVAAYDAMTRKPPAAESERIYVIAREQHQEKKFYL